MQRRLCVSLVTFLIVVSIPIARGAASNGHGSDRLARINHIVVIYQENHSFDNLYGSWEGVNGLSSAPPERTVQVSQGGVQFSCLQQNDVNLASPPLAPICGDTTTGSSFVSHFFNEPFIIDDYIPATATTCPNGLPNGAPGGCTKDLVHRFYQEPYQLNGGRQNRYVTGSDSIGLTMGVYRTGDLPIYRFLHADGHPHYAIGDAYFQAAFGGSFLNHQWLIAARTPVWGNAVNDGTANDLHSVVDVNGMPVNYPLYSIAIRDRRERCAAHRVVQSGAGPRTHAGGRCLRRLRGQHDTADQPAVFAGDRTVAAVAAPERVDNRRPPERCGSGLGVVLGRLVECERRRQQSWMDERIGADVRRPECARGRDLPELRGPGVPVSPPAVQLLRRVCAGHRRAHCTPARRGRVPASWPDHLPTPAA